MSRKSLNLDHQSSIENRQSSISRRIDQAAETGVAREPLKVFVAARVEAVFRAQSESRFKMGEGHVRISSQCVGNRQSVVDVILIGLQLIGFAEMLNGVTEVPGIQTGNTQGIVLVRRFGRRGGTTGSLPAKAQMQLGPFRHVACVNIYKLFKDFCRFVVILLMKSPNAQLKIPDGSLVGNIGVRPLRN